MYASVEATYDAALNKGVLRILEFYYRSFKYCYLIEEGFCDKRKYSKYEF